MQQADTIREFACRHYVEPARKAGKKQLTIRMGDVHSAMGLKDKLPAVCSALQASKFQTDCRLALLNQDGPLQGSNRVLTFEILQLSPPSVPIQHGDTVTDRRGWRGKISGGG